MYRCIQLGYLSRVRFYATTLGVGHMLAQIMDHWLPRNILEFKIEPVITIPIVAQVVYNSLTIV